MVMLAKAMTDEEMKQAADYFSAVKWRPHVNGDRDRHGAGHPHTG